jgi:hypothetical protein
MGRKRYSPEQIVTLLREAEVLSSEGSTSSSNTSASYGAKPMPRAARAQRRISAGGHILRDPWGGRSEPCPSHTEQAHISRATHFRAPEGFDPESLSRHHGRLRSLPPVQWAGTY